MSRRVCATTAAGPSLALNHGEGLLFGTQHRSDIRVEGETFYLAWTNLEVGAEWHSSTNLFFRFSAGDAFRVAEHYAHLCEGVTLNTPDEVFGGCLSHYPSPSDLAGQLALPYSGATLGWVF